MSEQPAQPATARPYKVRSVAVYPLSLGGSNAERLEIEAMWVPPYNAAKYGLSLTSSPFQADVILLYGSLTEKLAPLVYRLLCALPPDVKLLAVGSEAVQATAPKERNSAPHEDMEEAQKPDSRARLTKMKMLLPAHLSIAGYIVGSPPAPQALLDGILQMMATFLPL